MTAPNDRFANITQYILEKVTSMQLKFRYVWRVSNLLGHELYPRQWNNALYQRGNALVLFRTALEKHFTSPYWLTYNQATTLRGSIGNGEKAAYVLCDTPEMRAFLEKERTPVFSGDHTYRVFNADQVAGLPVQFYGDREPRDVVDGDRVDISEAGYTISTMISAVYTQPQHRHGRPSA